MLNSLAQAFDSKFTSGQLSTMVSPAQRFGINIPHYPKLDNKHWFAPDISEPEFHVASSTNRVGSVQDL